MFSTGSLQVANQKVYPIPGVALLFAEKQLAALNDFVWELVCMIYCT